MGNTIKGIIAIKSKVKLNMCYVLISNECNIVINDINNLRNILP